MLCISCFSIFAFGNLTARAILKNICISLTKKRGLQLGDPAYLPGQRYTGPLSFWPRLALCHSLALSEECTLGHVDYFFFFGSGQRVESTHPRYWIQLIVCLNKLYCLTSVLPLLGSVSEFPFHLRFRVGTLCSKMTLVPAD